VKYATRFCGYLVFDGKHFPVKGYKDNVVLLWGVDYLTHDIPHFVLAPSENYQAAVKYFRELRDVGYPLQYLVCDDNEAFKMAARYVYPKVIIQTCLNHYKENIRRDLCIRSRSTYVKFFLEIEKLFKDRLCLPEFVWKLAELNTKYGSDPNTLRWLSSLMMRKHELVAYHQYPNVPNTTNLIECYNSHLEARLKVIRGFENYHSAKLFLNGYILRRRLKNFTDCKDKFKHLNGTSSLQKTLKKGLKLPQLFD
jgi:transposase-like protein